MKITTVEPIVLRIPFTDGGAGVGITPQRWTMLDMVLVRVETDTGLVGWGEAFAYSCCSAVAAAVRDMIAPLVVGRELDDVAALNLEIQRKLALFGRYGITIFALSGVDIALWDLKAKAAGVSLAALLSPNAQRQDVAAYASLVRYGEAGLVARYSEQAAREGYSAIKLHEITLPEIKASRAAIGRQMKFTIDVNNAWSVEHAEVMLPELRALDTLWLEEPVFPPEDWETMTRLGRHGVAIAAGENACTAVEFSRLMPAVTYPQPSVTKVGGVTEFLAVLDMADARQQTAMPHSPYFGPGYFATLQLIASRPTIPLFEYLYVEPAGWAGANTPRPINGNIHVPASAGIGFEPNMGTLEKFRIKV